MSEKNYDIAVIGAGASGITCAVCAKHKVPDCSVVMLELKDRVGKKILATGNGKCNLSNSYENPVECYQSSDISFVNSVLKKYGWQDNVEFFRQLGLICRTDGEGRIYPYSQHSSSVLDTLRNECEKLGIGEMCNFKIKKVIKEKEIFKIFIDEKPTISAKNIVISTGGMSYSDGKSLSGYDILKSFGHRITELYPSLVPLKTENPIKSLKGIRTPAVATLFTNSHEIKKEVGEIQFTDYGISGIAIMQLSSIISRGISQRKNKKYVISLDLMPSYTRAQITGYINDVIAHSPKIKTEALLFGVFHKMLAQAIVKSALISPPDYAHNLSKVQINSISDCVKSFRFTVQDTMGFANAQVTGGGADVSLFSPLTMESKIIPGLYASGEVLDVSGICGGYNLNWAWSSGRIAGESVAERNLTNAQNK